MPEYIIAIVLALWLGLGFMGNRYLVWREWDIDRRIGRLARRRLLNAVER